MHKHLFDFLKAFNILAQHSLKCMILKFVVPSICKTMLLKYWYAKSNQWDNPRALGFFVVAVLLVIC